MIEIVHHPIDWVGTEVGKPRTVGGRVVVPVSCSLTPAFYAFADALAYSAHKYYPGLLPIGGRP